MDPGEEPGGPEPPSPHLFLDQTGAWKKIFCAPPPPSSQGLDPPLVVLLTGWSNFKKSEALPSHIISKEFLRMFLRHHFAGNCGCAANCWLFFSMKVKKSAVCTHEHIMQWKEACQTDIYRLFQKFVPIVNCILRKAFNASLDKCKLIQVRNLSK